MLKNMDDPRRKPLSRSMFHVTRVAVASVARGESVATRGVNEVG
jgi:hypothetical protein